MPSEPGDYRTPSPDEGHEAIRAPLAQAIDDLSQTTADAYFLTDALFDLLDSALTAIDDLTARVAALEPAPEEPSSAN